MHAYVRNAIVPPLAALTLLGLLGTPALSVPVPVPSVVGTPGVHGDQLFFFFDARTNRVPFLTVANLAASDIQLEIVFYSQDLSRELAVRKETVVALGNVVLDPTKITGVAGHAGLVVVTPVGGNPERPIVPPSAGVVDPTPPLFGSFTLANTELGAGFGQNPLARAAVNRRGERPADGLIVDGYDVRYQRFAPEALIVPSYFRPDTLSPTAKDGNRIILATFEDVYGQEFRIAAKALEFDAFFHDADGAEVATKHAVRVGGVHLDTLQNLAGDTPLQKSGKIIIASRSPIGDDANLFGLVAQALGTFSVGQRMPGIFLADRDPEKLVFAATAVQGAALGGLVGADSICQQDAQAAGLPGTYLAWMSDSKQSPSTRFTKARVPYVLPSGVKIADDWEDLIRGSLDHEIDVTANGGSFPDHYVYTNTDIHGRAEFADPSKICDDWTSDTNRNKVPAGNSRVRDVTWSFDVMVECGTAQPTYGLYCFEQ